MRRSCIGGHNIKATTKGISPGEPPRAKKQTRDPGRACVRVTINDQPLTTNDQRPTNQLPKHHHHHHLLRTTHTPVCLITPSKMVNGIALPSISTRPGSLTAGLLLLSLPGRGAKRVPLPAVWNMATLEPPARSALRSCPAALAFATAFW